MIVGEGQPAAQSFGDDLSSKARSLEDIQTARQMLGSGQARQVSASGEPGDVRT